MEGVRMEETERLTVLDRQNLAIRQQGYELTGAERKDKITSEYQEKIDKANFDNDPAEAEKQTASRDAELSNVDVDEASMSSGQKFARTMRNLERARAVERGRTATQGTRDVDIWPVLVDGERVFEFLVHRCGPRGANFTIPEHRLTPDNLRVEIAAMRRKFARVNQTAPKLLTT